LIFQTYMAWLIVCPHHKTGIFGLLYLFFVLFHQPTLHGFNEHGLYYKRRFLLNINKLKQKNFYKQSYLNIELNLFFQITYTFFVMCGLYTFTFLPYGRFYNRLGGNIGMLVAYFYVFVYLGLTSLRRPY
jgi:hypothetical protein